MSFTILLTCVGGEMSPQMIRSLKSSGRHDVTVLGVDTQAEATGRHFADAFATVPAGTATDYVDVIAELVARHGVDLVLPCSDEEALSLARHRGKVEDQGCRLACIDVDVLEIFADKAATHERLHELGLPVPAWQRADSLEAIRAAVASMLAEHGEAVVKPASARGGRGVCVIRSDLSGARPCAGARETHMDRGTFDRDYVETFSDALPAIVMQRLSSPVYDIDMLAWQGRPIRVVPRRRVNSALPNEGHTIVEDEVLMDLGRRIIENFSLSWLYDCDVMRDADGRPYVIEINPRPSGSIAATVAAGAPLLDDLISLARDLPLPDVEIPFGRVVIPYKAITAIDG